MASMARDAWTDGRLGDLKDSVDDGFREMRAEFRALRSETAAQNRMIIQLFAGMFGTMLVGFLGVVATIIANG